MTRRLLTTVVTAALALVTSIAMAQQLTLPNGAVITGTLQTNVAGDHVQAFRGIPYAEPPVGERRWKQATLKPPVTNLNATAFGKICYGDGRVDPQSSTFPASEDCLFLNVYSPLNATSSSKLPVMVWLHGGSFVAGASNIYDGANLLAAAHNNLIVVTLNYRLSVFGLLSGDPLKREGSGVNYALRDQEVAFQWVKQYISFFGGDVDSITAFGESAGAKSVFSHLISRDGNQQLFHRAIMQSGTLTTVHDVPTKTQQNAVFSQIATHVGCNASAEDTTLLSCVRAANTSAVWAAGGLLGWQPVVDNVFLRGAPIHRLLSAKVSKVPTIIGTNTDEGWLFTRTVKTAATVMPFVRSWSSLLTDSELEQLEMLYPSHGFVTPRHRASEIYGDAIYVCPSNLVSRMLAQSSGTTFRYRFNQTSMTFGAPLAVHTAEIRYVFNMAKGLPQDTATQALVRNIQRYWTTFATTGSPNTAGARAIVEDATTPSLIAELQRYRTVFTATVSPDGASIAPFLSANTCAKNATHDSLEWPQYDTVRNQQVVLQSNGLGLETVGDVHTDRCAFWEEVEQRLASSLAVA